MIPFKLEQFPRESGIPLFRNKLSSKYRLSSDERFPIEFGSLINLLRRTYNSSSDSRSPTPKGCTKKEREWMSIRGGLSKCHKKVHHVHDKATEEILIITNRQYSLSGSSRRLLSSKNKPTRSLSVHTISGSSSIPYVMTRRNK